MNFGAYLEFDDPSALNGYLDCSERHLGWTRDWLGALQWIELGSMAWADQALLALVICHRAALMGADC